MINKQGVTAIKVSLLKAFLTFSTTSEKQCKNKQETFPDI
jgi:hypothetical protein